MYGKIRLIDIRIGDLGASVLGFWYLASFQVGRVPCEALGRMREGWGLRSIHPR